MLSLALVPMVSYGSYLTWISGLSIPNSSHAAETGTVLLSFKVYIVTPVIYTHKLEPCIPDNKMTCCTKMHEGPASVATEPWAPWSGSVISETMEAISEPSRCHIDTPCYAHNDVCQHWNHTGRVTYAGCMTAAGHVLHRSTAACVQCPPVLLKNPLYP